MNYIYIASAIIFSISILMILVNKGYVHKIIGLTLLQSSILLFYIALGKVTAGLPPIAQGGVNITYTNPLPHVLMLTAIVVGFAVSAVGLAIIYQIKLAFNTIDSHQLGKLCDQ